jgi:hypothetical protein
MSMAAMLLPRRRAAIGNRAASLDYLVGAGEHRLRNFEAERLGGFEIDGCLILSWRLYGKISRFLPL